MKINRVQLVAILMIIAAVCATGWLFRQHQETGPTLRHENTEPKNSSSVTVDRSGETEQSRAERRAVESKNAIMSFHREAKQQEHPFVLALEKAMDSPAYVEFMKGKPSYKRWWDFLESQGMKPNRNVFKDMFRDRYGYPGELADYEPMMRKRLAALFLADSPIDTTDDSAVSRQRNRVLRQFVMEGENVIWYQGYFLGEGNWEWAGDVQKNAARIVESATPESVPPSPIPTQQVTTAVPRPTAVQEDRLVPETQPRISDESTPIADLELHLQTDAEIADEFTQFTSEELGLPTEASLEKALRQQVSPERFNRAINILNRYGPQEGLRRLKEADPGVAAQVERYLQRKQEEE